MPIEIDFDPATIPQPGDQHDPLVRKNQAEFQTMFGDFKGRHVDSFWVGPAPIGEWVGLYFLLENGEEVKVSIPFTLWRQFGREFVLAVMSAGELCETAYSKPEGNA